MKPSAGTSAVTVARLATEALNLKMYSSRFLKAKPTELCLSSKEDLKRALTDTINQLQKTIEAIDKGR